MPLSEGVPREREREREVPS